MSRKLLVTSAALASLLGAPSLALAQTESQPATIGDIVVTARKTQEAMQTTPVAVTALNTESLQQSGVVQVSDLGKVAPSINITTGGPGGPGVAFLSIRGQTNFSGNSTTDTPVATYINGVYAARATSGNLGFFDLQQVEILRGPQGTLFGRNTTGGALNVTTVQPNGEFGGYASAEVGNYNSIVTDGAVTIPLQGEQLSLRLAARYSERDGYFENALSGADTADLDHFYGTRATLKWAPEDTPLTLTVGADWTDWKDSGSTNALRAVDPAGLANGFAGLFGLNLNDYLVGNGGAGSFKKTYQAYNYGNAEIDNAHDDGETSGLYATVDLDFDTWAVKSITGFRRADADNSQDLDATPLPLVGFQTIYRQHQYSQELQASTTIGKLDVIGGAMWFKEMGREESISNRPGGFGSDVGKFSSESKALFAQGNYHFTDNLRGTLGYRYTWDERHLNRRGLADISNPAACGAGIPLTANGCDLPLSAKFNYPSWTVGFDYKLAEGAFVYVKADQASMSGGQNTREAPAGAESFQPEKTQDIEVGAKLDLLDRRLRANIALFAVENKGAQRAINGVRPSGAITQWTQNTGTVRTDGVELELTALPWTGMELTVGGAYLDSRYKKGSFVEPQADPLNPTGVVFVDRSGEPVPMVPEWAFSVGATQTFPMTYGDLSVHADYSYTDSRQAYAATAAPGASAAALAGVAGVNQWGKIPSFETVNGRVALAMNNGLEFSVWARNLLNEKYYTAVFSALYPLIGVATGTQGDPRTYGVGVKYNF